MDFFSRRDFIKALAGLAAFLPAAKHLASCPSDPDSGCPVPECDPTRVRCVFLKETCFSGYLYYVYTCNDTITGKNCGYDYVYSGESCTH